MHDCWLLFWDKKNKKIKTDKIRLKKKEGYKTIFDMMYKIK
jgi:hypothetical protein